MHCHRNPRSIPPHHKLEPHWRSARQHTGPKAPVNIDQPSSGPETFPGVENGGSPMSPCGATPPKGSIGLVFKQERDSCSSRAKLRGAHASAGIGGGIRHIGGDGLRGGYSSSL